MLTQSRAVLLLGLPAAVLLVLLILDRSGPAGPAGNKADGGLVLEADPEADWDRRIEAAVRRIAAKEEAVQELLAGRRKLEEVAAFFAKVDGNDPNLLRWVRCQFPGKSDEERRWRQVVSCARTVLEQEGDLDKERSVLARLEAELERLLREGVGLQEAQQYEQDGPAWSQTPGG
jgi:hypothetical protein